MKRPRTEVLDITEECTNTNVNLTFVGHAEPVTETVSHEVGDAGDTESFNQQKTI